MEPSCVMIKWSDLQPSPAWEHQGSDFNPSTCSAGLIKMNFLQATTLPTGQEFCYIWNTLLRYCIKFIVGRHRRTLRLIFLWHFFFSMLAFLLLSTFLLWSSLWNPSLLWQRLPYENGWSFYGAMPIYYVLGLVYLRGKERERGREREGGMDGKTRKDKKKWNERGGVRQGWKNEKGCFFQLWISLTYISEYFTTSSRKALSPPKGNTGRADRARESKPLTCWRLNK